MTPNLLASSILAVALCAGAARAAAQPATADAERELVAVAQALADAQRAFDPAAMDRLFADDYVEVSPVGEVDPRAKVLGFYAPEAKGKGAGVASIVVDEPTSRIHGDHAMLIVRQTMNVEAGGTTRAVAMRVTLNLRKVEGRWRISSAQYTPIPPPRKSGVAR